MLDKVILRLIEVCKEKNIVDENISLDKDLDKVVSALSKTTSVSKSTLESIFYKKHKTIQLDILYQLCRELNIKMDYFFDSNIFS